MTFKSKTRITKFKEWAKNNEIFFRIIEIVVLVIVTSGSLFVSINSYELSKFQTKLTESEHQPIFDFEQNYIKQNSSVDSIIKTITIVNKGDTFTNLHVELATFYDLIYVYNNSTQKIITRLPVSGYYNTNFRSNNTDGKIMFITSQLNFPNEGISRQIMTNFKQYCNINQDWGIIEPITYIEIDYRDIYGNKQTRYYHIVDSYNNQIDDKEGEKIFNTYYNAYYSRKTIDITNYCIKNSNNYFNEMLSIAKITKNDDAFPGKELLI